MDHLSQLIGTLTPTEKRYITRFSSLHTKGDENNYMKLFELLNRTNPQPDDALLQSELQMDSNNYAVTKNYLYNFILDALENYHVTKNPRQELDRQLHQAEILFDKHLISQSTRIVDRTKRRALELEQFTVLVRLMELELRMVHLQSDSLADQLKTIYALKQEYSLVWEKIHQINMLKNWYYEITYLFLQGGFGNHKEQIEQIIAQPSLQDEASLLSLQATSYMVAIKVRYYNAIQDAERGFYYADQQVKLMLEHPRILRPSNLQYINKMYTHCMMCLYSGRHTDFEHYLAEMLCLDPQTKHEQAALFFSHYNLLMQRDLIRLTIDNFLAYVDEMGKKLFKDDIRLSEAQRLMLYLQVANLYFIQHNIPLAQQWLNHVLNANSNSLRSDTYVIAHLKEIIYHYEEGNYLFLDSRIKNLTRSLRKRNAYHETEQLLLKFFAKAVKSATAAQRLQLIQQLKADITPLIDEGKGGYISNFIDIVIWIDSQLSNTSRLQLMRQRLSELS